MSGTPATLPYSDAVSNAENLFLPESRSTTIWSALLPLKMNPQSWGRYSEYLRTVANGPVLPGPGKRIALIGLPLLGRWSSPLRTALSGAFDRYEHWQIVFMSDAYLESFKLLESIPCDGVLARVVSREMEAAASALPYPVVNISSIISSETVQTVRRDDRQIGEMCARHLLDKRFARIAVVGLSPSPNFWCFHETTDGFVNTIRQHGDNVDLSFFEVGILVSEEEMVAQMRTWLRTLQTPCALFFTVDRLIITCITACREEGLRIPKDVAIASSILGPDNAAASELSITHPTPDAEWLVDPAFDRLASLMENPGQPFRSIVIPCPGMIQGESTDTIAVEDTLVAQAVDFIDAQFHEGINVADIVAHLACSRRALERRFSSMLNTTVHEYLAERRIAHAKKIIESSPGEKIDAVARRCGFSETKTFRHTFLRATGVTPGKWHPERPWHKKSKR